MEYHGLGGEMMGLKQRPTRLSVFARDCRGIHAY
jgi:hypothetical protein